MGGRFIRWLMGGALLWACSSSPSAGSRDSSAGDSSIPPVDGRVVDSRVVDSRSAVVDSRVIDSRVIDSRVIDASRVCVADSDCATGFCECMDASCSVRMCVDQACDCRYGDDCAALLDSGVQDPNSCAGESACYDGACFTQASEPVAPEAPSTIDTLTVVVSTLDEQAADTNQEVTLCLSADNCFSLARATGRFLDRGTVDSYQFEDLGLPRSQVDRVQLSMPGTNDWYPACISLRFDGEPAYCVDPAPFRLGDNGDAVASWSDPQGLHVDCTTCYPTLVAHGPMVGAVEPDRARIWVRTDATRSTALRLSLTPDPSWPATPRVDWMYTTADRDFTAVLEAGSLQPDTTYYYAIEVDGQIHHEPSYMFTTPPAKGQPTRFTFGFGSCARYNHEQTIFAPISAADPDLFLFAGDTHYGDSDTVAGQRWHYQWAVGTPTRAQLLAHTPTLGIWDDHDFVGNNSDGTSPARTIARRVFMEYWANPSYGENGEGVYYSYSYGDVDFFVLDDRYFRDPPDGDIVFGDPEGRRSILGPRQTEWLLERLAGSTATFKFVLSGSQWTRHGRQDSWASHLEARDAIFDYIASQGIEGVVLLSGDVHRTEFRYIPRAGGYDFPELTSSPLANTPNDCKTDEDLLSCHNNAYNVVFVEVDTTLADPTITARVQELSGDTLLEVDSWTIARSELGW